MEDLFAPIGEMAVRLVMVDARAQGEQLVIVAEFG